MINSAIIILLLPLLAALIQIFFGKRLPRQGDWLATGVMFVGLALSLQILFQALSIYQPNHVLAEQSWEWIKVGDIKLDFGIMIDNLTAVMLVVVTLVSALVHLYSIGYMHGDKRYSRYFSYLGLFSFSMLGLVLVDNFFGIFVFWELVGLSSYLLIGFWFEKDSAADAGKKAFITNRIGDLGMLAALMIIFATFQTMNFKEVFAGVADGQLSGGLLTLTGILLFCGAIGKSAQFPLHVWLPDAMEGPTPVSALIHAATMVAAGVYLVGRTFVFFSADALLFITYIGCITAFLGATIAIVQKDIKRVLAYSTISQLGYMMVGLGTGGYAAGLFHLSTHACFKACLFLGSGSVIHAVHSQDMDDMGGLRKKMPITFWTFLIATLALSGVPPFTGFFSKDAILASALEFGMHHPGHMIVFVIMLLSAGITAFYMLRLVYMTFAGGPRDQAKYDHAHESPLTMTIPLMILAALSIGSWGWFSDIIVNPAADAAAHADDAVAHTAHTVAMVLSIVFAGSGILLATVVYHWKKISAHDWGDKLKPVYNLLWNKYYFDEIYQATVIKGTLVFSKASAIFDIKIIDGIVNGAATVVRRISDVEGRFDLRIVDGAVNGIGNLVQYLGQRLRGLQSGQIQGYILFALFAVIILFLLQRF